MFFECLSNFLNCRYFHSFQFKMEKLLNHQNSLWIIIFELYVPLHEVMIVLCRDSGGSLRCWNQEIRESLPLRKKNN